MLSSISVGIFSLMFIIITVGVSSISHFSRHDLNICCIKDEWEGLMYLEVGDAFKMPQNQNDNDLIVFGVNASVHAAFSFPRKKVYFNIHGIVGSTLNPPTPYDATYLYDFETGTSYIYSVQDDNCQKGQFLLNMTRLCVPHDAKLLFTGVFGEEGRRVTTFQFNLTYDLTWLVTAVVFKKDLIPIEPRECEPIHLTVSSPSYPDAGMFYSMDTMDIGPIKSADVFHIPKPCLSLT